MKRMNLVLAAVAALLGTALAGSASAQDVNAFQSAGSPSVFSAQQYGRGGDYGRDHDNQGWGDHGRFRAGTLDGRWMADDRNANFGGNGRGMMRDLQLPDLINIDQKPNMVKIMDRRNRSLQVIMLGGKFDSRHGGDRPDYATGRWNGSTLVVQHTGPRGAAITQTFALQNRGRTLVVKTRREGFGPRTIEVTNTYHRA
ncbi:MAG TPA: hypothetical protein VN539_04705 [Candidatus Saccharimonadales bacterium]|nr:hypothetical protein [Candidatus Saccharimonadales bacterium]